MNEPVRGQIKLGLYVNNVTGRWSWFLSNASAGISVQFLGIWVTLALPRLWTSACLLYRRGKASPKSTTTNHIQPQDHESDRREPVLDPAGFAMDRLWNAGLPQNRLAGGTLPRRETNMMLHDLNLALMSAVFFILVIVLGTLTNLLTGDSKGLAESSLCGYYVHEDTPNIPADIAMQTQLQIDAASYAQTCYGGRGNALSGCNLFAQQEIAYNVTDEIDCPFEGEMCLLGNNSALRFTTGPVPAHALGFNTDHHLQFRRSTTFAPLVRNETFVLKQSVGGVETLKSYKFLYGWTTPISIAPAMNYWTYEWAGANDMMIDNTYEVGVVQEGPAYSPIRELQSTRGGRLTIIFVSNKGVRYAQRSDDPLFEARTMVEGPVPDPDQDQLYWMAGLADDMPRVLAAVDSFEWRDTRVGQEWITASPLTAGAPNSTSDGQKLLPIALRVSSIYDVISFRLATALNASSQTHPTSFFGALMTDQWKIEARQLFEASLARAQFETRSIALGLYAGLPNYIKSDISSEVCRGAYIVDAPGFSNVHVAPWMVTFLASLIIIIATVPTGTREDEKLLFERFPDAWVQRLAQVWVHVVDGIMNVSDCILSNMVAYSLKSSRFLISKTLTAFAKIHGAMIVFGKLLRGR